MKPKIFIISDYPSEEKPHWFVWVASRVEALKDIYDITVIKFATDQTETGIIRVEQEGFKICTLKVKNTPIPKVNAFFREYNLKKLLDAVVQKERPDLFHVHFSSYHSWIIRDLSRKYRIPYCITEHASFFERSIQRFYFGSQMVKALDDADRVFAVSSALKSRMSKHVRADVTIKYNIIDTDKFVPPAQRKETRNESYFISVGSLETRDNKGYEILIEALSEMKRNKLGFAFRCDIIGDGENRGKLLSMIEQYGLNENVRLLGIVPNKEMVSYYQEADFFVSSSRIETFGVAIIEAMSCGLPIVATRSGGPEEYITDETGILIDPESISQLSRAIAKMIENNRSFDKQKIRGKVESKFSKARYVEMMKQVYGELTGSATILKDVRNG